MSGSPSFRQLLGRVREVALSGYTHQDLLGTGGIVAKSSWSLVIGQ
ncbi:hypothetical protein [Nostoc commune]|nr:hypothetical protein [Nostoc commune]